MPQVLLPKIVPIPEVLVNHGCGYNHPRYFGNRPLEPE